MNARIDSLRVELRSDSPFVATAEPRLSWIVATDEANWLQTRAEVTDGIETVVLDGDDSALVAWPFAPLEPGDRRAVRVRAQAASGTWSDWSDGCEVAAGFLAAGEWVAQPVGLADPAREAMPTVVKTRFRLGRPVTRALLFWTALGVAEPEVNGTPVSEDVLSPGWTAYRDRLVHETVDVTALVREGENELSATLAGAWYTEKYGFFAFAARLYGTQPSFLAQLRVTFDDGTTTTVAATGDGWEAAAECSVVDSGIYAGEHQDLRVTAADFRPVRVGAAALPGYETVPVPEARIAPPVRRIETLPVADVLATPSGGTILDFGQNLVGRLRVRLRGDAGARVTIRHAEVLENGELSLRPLRNAAATATFDLSGGDDVLESRFSFYGFRYAEITGADVDPADVEAVVLHTDMTRTGWFAASDPLIERLHENVVWGMRGNFLSIPTDCPQRDERLGWTGDIQVFTPTASFLYDCAGFLASWLRDLAHEQARDDGSVPVVVPSVLTGFAGGASPAAWGDAATVVPTVLHERFGDRDIVAAQYESMRTWVDAVGRDAGERGLWAGRMQLGDWLDPAAPPDKPGQAKVDSDIVASAYYARSLRQVADAARLLGLETDAAHYGTLAERSRRAFTAEYVTPAGRMMSDAPTAYALALEFDLVTDPEVRAALADRLAALVREGGYRIGTRVRRHPAGGRRADPRRPPRRGRAPADADGMPVVALPRDAGRDHGLGAMGLAPARRHRESGRDDLVQPLRAGCGRRLAASDCRRPRACRSGLPAAAHRTSAARDAVVRVGPPPHPVRRGVGLVASRRRRDRGDRGGAGEHDRRGRRAGRTGRGRIGSPRMALRRPDRSPAPRTGRVARVARRRDRRPARVRRAHRHGRRGRPRPGRGGALPDALGRRTPRHHRTHVHAARPARVRRRRDPARDGIRLIHP
ncbi:alpha-L-rhamnosidase [Microbacterium sp. SORGH_AS 505]|nr:alpha-L-rhamnosidase [Microbacterium sp. SORGH_AS_0505]